MVNSKAASCQSLPPLPQAAEISNVKQTGVAAVNAHQHAAQQALIIGEQGRRCGICLTCTQQRQVNSCLIAAGPKLLVVAHSSSY